MAASVTKMTVRLDIDGAIPLEFFVPFLGDKINQVDTYELEPITDAETGDVNFRLCFYDKDGNVLGVQR